MELLAIEWGSALNVCGFTFVMVFLLLILIVLVLNIFGKLLTSIDKASKTRVEREANLKTSSVSEGVGNELLPQEIPGEDIAAISMALHSYFSEAHDNESSIVTIQKVNKPYSPWSSKIYGLNALPH